MADKISPEERLFKIIQDGKKSPSEGGNFRKKKRRTISPRGVKWFFANLSPVRKRVPKRIKSKTAAVGLVSGAEQEIAPKTINKVLGAVLIILTGLAVHNAVNKKEGVVRITDAVSSIRFQKIKKERIEFLKPLPFYLEEVKKRDIFQPTARKQENIVLPDKKSVQDKLKEMAEDIKLQGIAWSQFPKAMIRNEKEDKVYFLRRGQTIGSTGIEVKTIFKDKIVIRYEGEEMDLL